VHRVERVQVNKPALDRRAATHLTRRTGEKERVKERDESKKKKKKKKNFYFFDLFSSSVKKQTQLAWLVRVIQCIDLTTLSGDDTVRISMREEW
jgi:hypothetical protein